MEKSNSIIVYKVGTHLIEGEFVRMSEDHIQSFPFTAICHHNGILFVEFGLVQDSIHDHCFAFSGELILQKQMTVMRLEVSCINRLDKYGIFHQYLLQGEWINDYIVFDIEPVSLDFEYFIKTMLKP